MTRLPQRTVEPQHGDDWQHTLDSLDLFHDASKRPFVRVNHGNHSEVYAVASGAFKDWLRHRYYEIHESPLERRDEENIVHMLSARATYEGAQRPLYCRAGRGGSVGDALFLDIGDGGWQVIEVSDSCWRIVEQVDGINFIRPRGMLALPRPVSMPGVELRLQLLFGLTAEQLHLLITWLVLTLLAVGPFPILRICGEYALLLAELIRLVVDPVATPIRAVPKEERDLRIAAQQSWVVVLSVQLMRSWLADALYNFYSDAAFGSRRNYEDSEEVVLDGRHPIVLVSTEPVLTRPDVLSTTITLDLRGPSAHSRRSETEIREECTQLSGGFLGYLLSALSDSLVLKDFRPQVLPRLTEFCLLGARLECALWTPGSFLSAYAVGRAGNAPIVKPLVDFSRIIERWSGTATTLLSLISCYANELCESSAWPQDPQEFGKQLRAIKRVLEEFGITIIFGREPGGNRDRIITLQCTDGGLGR
jgi:hypothetical protein